MNNDSLFNKNYVEKLFKQRNLGLKNNERLFSLVILEKWRKDYGVAFYEEKIIRSFRCPSSGSKFQLVDPVFENNEVKSGTLFQENRMINSKYQILYLALFQIQIMQIILACNGIGLARLF